MLQIQKSELVSQNNGNTRFYLSVTIPYNERIGPSTYILIVAGTAYTKLFSLTGNPVVVLPLARSADRLPIGLQVVGRRWGDIPLLAVAERLALIIGPFARPPIY